MTQTATADTTPAASAGAAEKDEPLLVYFSSTSENTHRFATKLGYPTARIPLRRSLSVLPFGVAMGATVVGPDGQRVPVEMDLAGGATVEGHIQLIDPSVDPANGTVGIRVAFSNADGALLPGQFARIRLGEANAAPAILVAERAVGTDQSRKFVFVVDKEGKAEYRAVTLGPVVDGLRVVRTGLEVTVIVAGVLLGGTLGVATILYALAPDEDVRRRAGAAWCPSTALACCCTRRCRASLAGSA